MSEQHVSDMGFVLGEGAQALGVDLDPAVKKRLLELGLRILKTSRTVNLTGARDLATLVEEHILDSLALAPLIRERAATKTAEALLVDVGSGGGFPALPILMAFENTKGLCVESVGKKARALVELAGTVAPGRVTVLNDRAERVAHDPAWREKADVATARGVARLVAACELTLPFLRPGGVFLAQKGRDPQAEIDEARGAIVILGGQLGRTVRISRPGRPPDRTVVLIEKVGPTPRKFPRRPGIPAKRPLREAVQ